MEACTDHANGHAFTRLDQAIPAAARTLDRYGDDKTFIAEWITELGQPACCPAGGYARSLMRTAFRLLLTPVEDPDGYLQAGYDAARRNHGDSYADYLIRHDRELHALGRPVTAWPLSLRGNDGD